MKEGRFVIAYSYLQASLLLDDVADLSDQKERKGFFKKVKKSPAE